MTTPAFLSFLSGSRPRFGAMLLTSAALAAGVGAVAFADRSSPASLASQPVSEVAVLPGTVPVRPAEPRPTNPVPTEPRPATSVPSEPEMVGFGPLTSPDSGDFCADDLTADGLNAFFSEPHGEFRGADYQRALRLDDDRVLWLFQDVFLGDELHLAHNVAMVQSGRCFTVLANDDGNRSWLNNDATVGQHRWFWAAGSHQTADGMVQIVLLEMVEHGDRYLEAAGPVAQHVVTVNPDGWTVESVVPAPWSSTDMYGWSITSDGSWTYLYSWCYRQFGGEAFPFHDACTSDVRLARVPDGADLATATLEYWTGTGWVAERDAAAVVFGAAVTGNSINPVEVTFDGTRFVAVSKPGDWWGATVHVYTADSPVGPWTVEQSTDVPSKCGDGCNTYWANLLPYRSVDGQMMWALSNNTWSGVDTAVYRPTVHTSGL